MTTPLAARAAASRISVYSGILLFVALAIVGLFFVKWSPYYAKGFLAAQNHSIGTSIVSGGQSASPGVSLQAGLDYSIAYMKAIWQALVLGLILGSGVQTALPRMPLTQLFTGTKGSLRATAFALPSMMCTCCCAPVAVGMIESGVSASSSLIYWLPAPAHSPPPPSSFGVRL